MSMNKIAIITELRRNSINYGEKLQAYALNKYLNNYEGCYAETLFFDDSVGIEKEAVLYTGREKISSKVFRKIQSLTKKKQTYYINDERNGLFNKFMEEKIITPSHPIKWEGLLSKKYDVYIVGSDVVWTQTDITINRIKFLDFVKKKNGVRKIAYAASMGGTRISKKNSCTIRELLDDFSAISVREKSSVDELNELGIKQVEHVCDPTLLISQEEWENMAVEPLEKPKNFVFCYVLGDENKKVECLKKKMADLSFVAIENGSPDQMHYDMLIKKGAIGEWIWLIKEAEYVITDSFHGMIFSLIFQKKFILIGREDHKALGNLNIRLIDFLSNINEQEKLITNVEEFDLTKLNWNYKSINERIKEIKEKSIKFLDEHVR